MVRNNGNNARGRRRRPAQPRRLQRIIDRVETGVKFVPGVDPPEYARSPWWPITVVDLLKSDKQYTSEDLHTGVFAMMGISSVMNTANPPLKIVDFFELRVQTVRIWGMAKQPISLSVAEIFGKGTHRIRQLADHGSAINYSRLGWRFGSASRVDPVLASDKTYICHVGGDISDAKHVLVYFQVMVSIAAGVQPSLQFDHNMINSFEHCSMV